MERGIRNELVRAMYLCIYICIYLWFYFVSFLSLPVCTVGDCSEERG